MTKLKLAYQISYPNPCNYPETTLARPQPNRT